MKVIRMMRIENESGPVHYNFEVSTLEIKISLFIKSKF